MNSKQAKRFRDLLAAAVADEPNAFAALQRFLKDEGLHVDDLGIGASVGSVGAAADVDGVDGADGQDTRHDGADSATGRPDDKSRCVRAEEFILGYLAARQITSDYAGVIKSADENALLGGRRAKVGRSTITVPDLECDIRIEAHRQGVRLGGIGFLRAVLRAWFREQQQNCTRSVFDDIDLTDRHPMSPQERLRAWSMLVEICRLRFAEVPEYAAAAIETLIRQIKLKMLGEDERIGLPVVLLIHSKGGGTGKSTLARRILSPLKSLLACTTVAQLLDPQNRDLWSRYALYCDDVGQDVKPSSLADFRRKVTLDRWEQRVPRTGRLEMVVNKASTIMTSNFAGHELLPDTSSMRRLIELRSVEHTPDAEAERVLDETDWGLIWRSVDVDAERPMEARGFRSKLSRRQEEARTKEPVEMWLAAFSADDPGYLAHAVKGRITSRDLFEHSFRPFAALHCKAGANLTLDGFGKKLGTLTRSMGDASPLIKIDARTTTMWALTEADLCSGTQDVPGSSHLCAADQVPPGIARH